MGHQDSTVNQDCSEQTRKNMHNLTREPGRTKDREIDIDFLHTCQPSWELRNVLFLMLKH